MNIIVEEISGYYREYNEGITELLEGPASSFSEPVKKFAGMGTVKSSPLHGQFFTKVKDAVERLEAELKENPDGQAALEAINQLLFYDRNVMDDSILLGFGSAEGLALPLVEFLTEENAAAVQNRYGSLNDPKKMLPNQYKLFRALSAKASKDVKEKKFLLQGKGELKKRKSIFGNKNK